MGSTNLTYSPNVATNNGKVVTFTNVVNEVINLFKFTGTIKLFNIFLFNTAVGTPAGSSTGASIGLSDTAGNLSSPAAAGLNLTAAISPEGHLIKWGAGSAINVVAPAALTGTVANKIVMSTSSNGIAPGTSYSVCIESTTDADSWISMIVGQSGTTTNYSGTYDIYLEWLPITAGATVTPIP